MSKVNKQAWDTLTEDEQSALALQIGMDKSSWQAGEIIGRSHYKYLEIKYRASYFLKLFTEHLDFYDRLITDLNGDKTVLEYFRICVEKRVKPMAAVEGLKINKSRLNERVIAQMNKWQKSEDAHELITFELIKNFDRWNNFRILPKSLQEPSAYKRRVKNIYKKHLKVISNIPPLSIRKLLKLYQTNRRPYIYMPIIEIIDGKKQPSIYKVKENKGSRAILDGVGLYLFVDYEDAKEYIDEVWAYVGKGKKECTDGLIFWPKYREIIKKAKNYLEVQKITPSRKWLEMAMSKLEYL
jgi:hypothetical protein